MKNRKLVAPRKFIKSKRTQFLSNESNENWNKDLIVQMIQILKVSTKRMTLNSLGLNKAPLPDPVLSSILGRPCSRKFLYHVACHHFGTWNLALEASEVTPVKTSYNRFWNPALIIKAIQRLHKAGHSLSVKDIWRDRSRTSTKILFEITGKNTTGSALHDAARRNFGSWDKALMMAGINVQDVKEKPFWTKTKVISAIHALHKEKIPLNCLSLVRDQSRYTKKIIEQRIGKGRTGQSLYGGGYRAFGSWDRALSEAGIPKNKVRKVDFFWNRRSVARILRILYELQVPINSSSISKDTSDETKEIIYNYTGQIEPGTKIYRLGHRMIGRWDDVLKYSGFKLSSIRRSGVPCDKDQERIVEFIRLFNRYEYSLNHSAVTRHSHQMKFLMEDNYGYPVSGSSLLKTANNLFGSWDSALWQAGLDPSAIRLRSRPNTSALSVTLHQKEDVNIDGERRYSRFAGVPSKSPEQILEDRESASDLSSALKTLSQQDKELTEQVFDAILQIHHYRDQDDLIKHIVLHLDKKVSEFKIKEIFSQLAQNITQHN